jgi:hypothetical protein
MGDYRTYLPDYRRRRENVEARSKDYELWRNDVRDLDLDLLEDKLERAVREAYNKHLLVDAGVARLVLVLPSVVPHPVLSTMLMLLFERWKFSTITLLPAPTMSIVAAGLRSGIVVDIGWEETIVTTVFEYREIQVRRTERGMKALIAKIGSLLEKIRQEQDPSFRDTLVLDFDFVEEFVIRAGACHALLPASSGLLDAMATMILENGGGQQPASSDVGTLALDWPTHTSSKSVSISLASLHRTCLDTFVTPQPEEHPDDHEHSISQILYMSLLSLNPDVRSSCISRIMFTGSGSDIAGLSEELLKTVGQMSQEHGWNAVRGKHVKPRQGLAELTQGRTAPADARHDFTEAAEGDRTDMKVLKAKAKGAVPPIPTTLRQVDTLGAWAGASLMGALKAKPYVEIERDRFLHSGLAGANKFYDPSALQPQQRATTTKGNERASWTLAGWG